MGAATPERNRPIHIDSQSSAANVRLLAIGSGNCRSYSDTLVGGYKRPSDYFQLYANTRSV
ncbi:hypothetical protein [Paenibacillus taiwanensis]|uniref:hypothetical protein n=1 Tax=Paenibacillus taiwanensis TaxID=401638 RepID=UPI001469A9A2|nr:hypothetical protein [Paenibacillus taiwanensis]